MGEQDDDSCVENGKQRGRTSLRYCPQTSTLEVPFLS